MINKKSKSVNFEPFGFYGKPVIKKVGPLRKEIINVYRKNLKLGKFDAKKGLP